MLSLSSCVLSLLLCLLLSFIIVVSDRIHLYESSLCLSHFFVTLYKPIGLMNKVSKDYYY
jgi:uncharacterized membrane protein YiaA